ncbi:MAG: MmcQ/YjbR family DNA-binding protein [Chitinophagaceae bacterium]|nr:MmcQ/YjbR family DNA-binding protein [Chitinophagaceae bacterium]
MDIENLRTLCLHLPGVTEDVKWDNDLVFSVANKMFCAASLEPPFRISFKVTDEEFELLTDREGFMPAPYLARAKWIAVTDPVKLSLQEWEYYTEQSYQLVKARLPKKTRLSLGLE